MGMVSYDKKNVSVRKGDVSIAKNYLNEEEIKLLGLLVEQYLAFAEAMAQQHTPMYMEDWIQRLDAIIQLNGRELRPTPAKSAIRWPWTKLRWSTKSTRNSGTNCKQRIIFVSWKEI